MSSSTNGFVVPEKFCTFLMERIAARAAYLKNRAARDLVGPASDLRLAMALEELVERIATSGIGDDDFENTQFATALSGHELGPYAQAADHQLRQRGAAPDVLLPDDPRPDEARVLQVLLRLREIPRLDGDQAAEVIRNALLELPLSQGDSSP